METQNQSEQNIYSPSDIPIGFVCRVLSDKIFVDEKHIKMFSGLNLTNFEKTEKEIISKRRAMQKEFCN